MLGNFMLVLLLTILSINCAQQSNPLPPVSIEQIKSDDAAIDRERARQLSDKVVEDLINQDKKALRENAVRESQEYYSEEQFNQMLAQMNFIFGKPLEAEFKNDELGYEMSTSGRKPMRKFWYAVKTTKYEKGSRFLFVTIVPDGERLAFSAFSIVMFPMGVPSQLK